MSKISTSEILGILPAQDRWHARRAISLSVRPSMLALRILDRLDGADQLGHWAYEQCGDVIGLLLWEKTTRPIPAWASAFGSQLVQAGSMRGSFSVRTAGGQALPIRNSGWEHDERLAEKGVSSHPDMGAMPAGTVGIVLMGTAEDDQHDLFFPTDRRLIAVNYAGHPDLSTIVCDLTDADEIDMERTARLHSMMRVIRATDGLLSFDPEFGELAWQIGLTGKGDPRGGYGLIYERSLARGVIGCAGIMAAGPLTAGLHDDKHRISETDEEPPEPINAAHLGTGTYWIAPRSIVTPTGREIPDGPLHFDLNLYSRPRPGPFRIPVEINYDPEEQHEFLSGFRRGKFRLEARSFYRWVDAPPIVETPSPADVETPAPPVPPQEPRIYSPRDPASREVEKFAGTVTAIAQGTCLIRPPLSLTPGALDVRSIEDVPVQEAERIDRTAPIIGRVEAMPGYLIGGEINYTQRPGDSRYPGGTACGSNVHMPPEVDITDIDTDFAPPGVTKSTTADIWLPGARVGFGLVQKLDACAQVKLGHDIESQGDGTTDITAVTEAGVRTRIMTLPQTAISEQINGYEEQFPTPTAWNTASYAAATTSDPRYTLFTDGANETHTWKLKVPARQFMAAADSQGKVTIHTATTGSGDMKYYAGLFVERCGITERVLNALLIPEYQFAALTQALTTADSCIAIYFDQSIASPGDTIYVVFERNGAAAGDTVAADVAVVDVSAQWVPDGTGTDTWTVGYGSLVP